MWDKDKICFFLLAQHHKALPLSLVHWDLGLAVAQVAEGACAPQRRPGRATALFAMTPQPLSAHLSWASRWLLPGNLLIVSVSVPAFRLPAALGISSAGRRPPPSLASLASASLVTAPYLPGFAKAYYVWSEGPPPHKPPPYCFLPGRDCEAPQWYLCSDYPLPDPGGEWACGGRRGAG